MADQARRPNVLRVDASIAAALGRRDGDWVTVGGIVGAVTTVSIAAGERLLVITLDDFHASIEVLVGARLLTAFEPQLDDVILVGGRLSRRARRMLLRAQLVERFEFPLPDDGASSGL